MPDCGDNSCLYAPKPRRGMRTNGGCRCDRCPACTADIRPGRPVGHYVSCPQQEWVPEHHRATYEEARLRLVEDGAQPGSAEPPEGFWLLFDALRTAKNGPRE